MHEHECVDLTLCDQPCSNHGLAKGGAGRQDPIS
jgi:hypothetical protein